MRKFDFADTLKSFDEKWEKQLAHFKGGPLVPCTCGCGCIYDIEYDFTLLKVERVDEEREIPPNEFKAMLHRLCMAYNESVKEEVREDVWDELRRLNTEIDCRIEHGAESGGHLEYVREHLLRILKREEQCKKS